MNAVSQLHDHVTIGEPRRHGRLDVFPLFVETAGTFSFVLLDAALADQTAEVTEASDGGSVPVLKLISRSNDPILALDGEELIGAKQNRILNTSVLAPPGVELLIPVSCVEQGRWRYSSHHFRASDHTLFARGRARKADRMAKADAENLYTVDEPFEGVAGEFDADQSAIWSDVSDKLRRMRVTSASAAINDGYKRYDTDLEAFERVLTPQAGQRGAVFALHGVVVGIELLATEAAFRAIFRKLVRGYAFDAIEEEPGVDPPPPGADAVRAFMAKVFSASISEKRGVGLGSDLRLTGSGFAGHALVHEGEVVHLAAFASALAD